MNYTDIKFRGGSGGAGGIGQKVKHIEIEASGAPGFGDDVEAFRKDAHERWQRFNEKLFKETQDEVIKNFEYPDVRNVRIYHDLTKASDFALGLEAGGIKNISIVKVEDHWEVRYV